MLSFLTLAGRAMVLSQDSKSYSKGLWAAAFTLGFPLSSYHIKNQTLKLGSGRRCYSGKYSC